MSLSLAARAVSVPHAKEHVVAGALVWQAQQIPEWACGLNELPADGGEGLPSGNAQADVQVAKVELTDAAKTRVDALKLHKFAGATDESDARALLGDATREAYEADFLLKAVKKEELLKVDSVNSEFLSRIVHWGTVPAEQNAEAKGEVENVNTKSLMAHMDKHKEVVVVFYARWCKHCKNFVMEDEGGNPEKAPLEVLNNKAVEKNGPKVVKFDIDADKVPEEFDVQYVPTVVLVDSQTATMSTFPGDPQEVDLLEEWAFGGISKAIDGKRRLSATLDERLQAREAKAKAAAKAQRHHAAMLQVQARSPAKTASWATITDEIDEYSGKETRMEREAERELEARTVEVSAIQDHTDADAMDGVPAGPLADWLAKPKDEKQASGASASFLSKQATGKRSSYEDYLKDLS